MFRLTSARKKGEKFRLQDCTIVENVADLFDFESFNRVSTWFCNFVWNVFVGATLDQGIRKQGNVP